MPKYSGAKKRVTKLLKLLPVIVASLPRAPVFHFAHLWAQSLHFEDRVISLAPDIHSEGLFLLSRTVGESFVCFFTKACRFP